MFELLRRNPVAVLLSAFAHVLVVAFMIVGVDWRQAPQKKTSKVEVVQARVVDESRLQSEIDKQKARQLQKQQAEQSKRKVEQKRLQDLKRKQAAEKKRLADLEKKRLQREVAEQQKRSEAKKRTAQEKKRLAELEKQRKQAEKKVKEAERKRDLAEQKRLVEEKRRAVEESKRLAAEKARKQAEAKRLEEQKKRQAEEAERARQEKLAREKAEREAREKAEREAREQAMAEQLAAEESARARSGAIAAITDKIQRNWLRPIGTTQGLKCTVRVRLIPTGDIVPGTVEIIKSSGNGAFDRSVEKAIYKAEPLPVPKGPAFEYFRSIDFVFDPAD